MPAALETGTLQCKHSRPVFGIIAVIDNKKLNYDYDSQPYCPATHNTCRVSTPWGDGRIADGQGVGNFLQHATSNHSAD